MKFESISWSGVPGDQLLEQGQRCVSGRKGLLQRQKTGCSYLYLAVDPDTAKEQRRYLQQRQPAQLPAEIAVLVFAQFIRTPQAHFRQLATRVSRSTNLVIDAGQIRVLFDWHGLKKMT